MKQFETRVEYMDAIARALGLGGIDDLSYAHRNVLQVEHFARLSAILDMVETAAGLRADAPFDEAETSAVEIVGEVLEIVNAHRDSKVRAVQALVAELDAAIAGAGHADLS